MAITSIEFTIPLDEVDEHGDVQVEGKVGRIVLIAANSTGRQAVEDVFPDVRWSTGEKFAEAHSPEWGFTHVAVTKLQPSLEDVVPLAFCGPDALGYAVALAIKKRQPAARVIYFTGYGLDLRVNIMKGAVQSDGLRAEYVPPGPIAPGSGPGMQ
jgi:hypothetical protein